MPSWEGITAATYLTYFCLPSHVFILTNQMLVYKDFQVILRIVIPIIENVDRTSKLILRINLGISRVHKTGHNIVTQFNPALTAL